MRSAQRSAQRSLRGAGRPDARSMLKNFELFLYVSKADPAAAGAAPVCVPQTAAGDLKLPMTGRRPPAASSVEVSPARPPTVTDTPAGFYRTRSRPHVSALSFHCLGPADARTRCSSTGKHAGEHDGAGDSPQPRQPAHRHRQTGKPRQRRLRASVRRNMRETAQPDPRQAYRGRTVPRFAYERRQRPLSNQGAVDARPRRQAENGGRLSRADLDTEDYGGGRMTWSALF